MGTIVPQGGWSQPIVAQSQPELLDREIRFIVLGDTQFANKGVFESMVYEIEGLRPNFVVQVGDMIQGYTHNPEQVRKEWKEYFRQLAPLTAPFVPVAGNHDAVTPESELVWKETFGENRGHYSLDFGPVHLVVLNTWHGEEDDRIAEWQREWLKSDLQAWKERTEGFPEGTEGSVFVFTHSPLWRYKEDRPGYQDWLEVEKILADYPVKLVVGGHTHEHVNEVRNGINYLVLVSSGLITQNNPRNGFLHSYLHVSVLPNGDVRYGAIKAGSVLPLDTVTDEERGKLKDYYLRDEFIRVADWNEGTPLDQEIVVVLENPAPEARSFHLRWFTPKGSPVKTNIPEQWVEVEAKGTQVIKYRLQGETTPELSQAPRLEITAEPKEVPTGAIPKATLQRLSQSDSATNIPLVEKVEYKATYRLYEPPQATAQKRTDEIVIDGNLTDKGWESIPAIES
ncbi:MAG: metallophosphoesterase, partial [Candidatus Sumerlaeia bacterium]|nr:metallophosphoesterase [Candidatus Sumerlaeia bacterium]